MIGKAEGKENALHPDVKEFITCLLVLERILKEYENGFWTEKISKVRTLAERSDGYSVELFLSYFGGMGSFNDSFYTAPNLEMGEFYSHQERAYELATALRQK